MRRLLSIYLLSLLLVASAGVNAKNSGTGNLTSRTIGGTAEQFTYDSLDRLTGGSVSGGTGTYVMYDTNGNIDIKHDTAHPIGSYYYDCSRPHAVTDIENPLGAVDLPSDYVSVSYNELGKAATVTDDGNPYVAYHYGPDHERWRGVQHVGSSTWSNLYFGDYEERYVNSNIRRSFVYLDGGVLAVSDNGGSYQFYYIHMNLWDRNSDSHQTLWQVLVPYTFVNSCIKVPVPLIPLYYI